MYLKLNKLNASSENESMVTKGWIGFVSQESKLFMNSLIHWFACLFEFFFTEVMNPTLILIGVAVLLSLQSVWCVQEDATHGGGHGKDHNPIHKEHYHDGAHDPHYDHEAILGMSTYSSVTSV